MQNGSEEEPGVIAPVKSFLVNFFFTGHARTLKTKRNVVALFLLRGISMAINLLLVPLTLNYLNPTKYGIWLTLTSLIAWVNVLDFGLGNGLRNKFAEALARNDDDSAKMYVSTTYFFIGVIMLGAIIVFLAINPFLNWARILNTPAEMGSELSSLAAFVATFFCMRLLFGLIGTVLLADQRPAMSNAVEVVTNGVSLCVIYLLTRVSNGSLFWLGFAVSFLTAAVPFIFNFWFFSRDYRRFLPSLKFVRIEHGRELVTLGIKFFILSITGIVTFATSNIIITQMFGPAEVTPFNIAFKYYGIGTTAFTIILTPLWSAYTEAFVRGDTEWILRTMKKMRAYWLLLAGAIVVMTLFADLFYGLWVGKNVQVPILLSACMGAYVLITTWCNLYGYVTNAVGKVQLQIRVAIAVSLAIIPVSVLCAGSLGLRSAGVVLGTCICMLPGCFIWPIQARKIVTGEASGVWAK